MARSSSLLSTIRIRRLSIDLFFRRALGNEEGKNKRFRPDRRFPLALYDKAPRGVSNNISKEWKIKN
jgi:hypothetical protein